MPEPLTAITILGDPPGRREPPRLMQHVARGDRTLCGVEFGCSLSDLRDISPSEQAKIDAAPRCASGGCGAGWPLLEAQG